MCYYYKIFVKKINFSLNSTIASAARCNPAIFFISLQQQTSMSMCKYVSFHLCQLEVCQFVSMSVCNYVSLQLCQFSSMSVCNMSYCQLCQFASMSVASMSVCKYISLHLCEFFYMSYCQYVSLKVFSCDSSSRSALVRLSVRSSVCPSP